MPPGGFSRSPRRWCAEWAGPGGRPVWIDPDRELIVVLLTNRVHPSGSKLAIRIFKPKLHDLVVDCLGDQKR